MISRRFFLKSSLAGGVALALPGTVSSLIHSGAWSTLAEPLLEVKTLAQYTDWMKGIMTVLPDGHYEVKSFATDETRNNVAAYGVFHGTHTGPGGPVPPTGRRTSTDYVYVMQFEGDKIVHMTKIWHAGLAMKELGWS